MGEVRPNSFGGTSDFPSGVSMTELLASSLEGSSDPELEGHAPGRKGVDALRRRWRKGDKDGDNMREEVEEMMEEMEEQRCGRNLRTMTSERIEIAIERE